MKIFNNLKLFYLKQSRKIFFWMTISLLIIGFSVSYANLQVQKPQPLFITLNAIQKTFSKKYLIKITVKKSSTDQNLYTLKSTQPFSNEFNLSEILRSFQAKLSQTNLATNIKAKIKRQIFKILNLSVQLEIISQVLTEHFSEREFLLANQSTAITSSYINKRFMFFLKSIAYDFSIYQTKIKSLQTYLMQFLVYINSLTIKHSIIKTFINEFLEMINKSSSLVTKMSNNVAWININNINYDSQALRNQNRSPVFLNDLNDIKKIIPLNYLFKITLKPTWKPKKPKSFKYQLEYQKYLKKVIALDTILKTFENKLLQTDLSKSNIKLIKWQIKQITILVSWLNSLKNQIKSFINQKSITLKFPITKKNKIKTRPLIKNKLTPIINSINTNIQNYFHAINFLQELFTHFWVYTNSLLNKHTIITTLNESLLNALKGAPPIEIQDNKLQLQWSK